jgi:hypothetical protein
VVYTYKDFVEVTEKCCPKFQFRDSILWSWKKSNSTRMSKCGFNHSYGKPSARTPNFRTRD